MKIRRFYSHNVRTALKQVVEVFGEDAAILSNKKVPGGVEVIAALDYDESLMPPTIESSDDRFEKNKTNQELPTGEVQKSSLAGNFGDSFGQIDASDSNFSSNSSAERGLDNNRPAINSINQTATPSAERDNGQTEQDGSALAKGRSAKLEWSLDPSLQAMKEELSLLRTMMAEQLKGIGWERFTEKDPLKAMIMRRLSKLGVNRETLNLLLPHLVDESDAECSWQRILAVLAKSVPIANNELLEKGGIYALLGPTGVGKSTTIAKLAARFAIKHGSDSIALISTDNYRISAQEQLATFGRILKIPVARVDEKHSLDGLLKKFASKKLILIDTAGISSNEPVLMKQFATIVGSHKPIHKLLLMSAASQAAVLQQSLQLFSSVSPDGLIITKLDEATSLGEILSVVIKAGVPLVYTTDGQKIPEDIRIARSHHLVSKAVWLANKYTIEADEWLLAQNMQQAKTA